VRGLETRHEVPSRGARTLIDDAVVEMSAKLDDSATVVSEAIHRACQNELADDLYLATRQSTRANLGLITTLISEGSGPTQFTAPEEALSYARSYVHEGLSFDLLTRAYREGEHAYSRLWLEQLHKRAEDAHELAESMAFVSDWLFAYIGAINHPLSVVYTAEHERWIRGGVAMRSEEVRAILAGAQVDVTEASSRLRYRLDARHLGFVIWSKQGDGGKVEGGHEHRVYDEMDRLGAEIADVLEATSSLLLPIGSYYAGWAAVATGVDLRTIPKTSGNLRIAVGRVGRGIEGFRRTHQEALLAKRVASLSERPTTAIVNFSAIALDSLLTQDLDEARRFVQSEIGPLIEDSDASRRLASTLEVFLQEESSFVRAARRLGIHENTVAYRVRRAEELLGRRVCERQLELRAALRLASFVRGEAPDV
jgi:hypothetical protein